MAGSRPIFSMMSISPHCGQPAESMFTPSIQKAGQSPWPRGTRIRASKRPYAWAKSPLVLSRVDVYRHLPYQHSYADEGGSARAVIDRKSTRLNSSHVSE